MPRVKLETTVDRIDKKSEDVNYLIIRKIVKLINPKETIE